MKKLMNSILFFGSCFIAAILIEAYSIQIMDGNLFSTTGLGIVVLITGYLFMDSIRNSVKQNSDKAKFYMDSVLSEDAEKWSERYTELISLQKASYTATKKNTAIVTEQFEEVLSRLEALEIKNAKAWQKILELQKKSLEGQKNALNLEISYNKENTKKLIGILRGEDKNRDVSEQIERILSILEKNNAYGKKSASEEADLKEILENNPKVIPLYDDPNKSLTADEIATLFASYGK